MNSFTLVFLTALTAATAAKLWLAWRQLRHVRAHRAQVPDAFSDKITVAMHQRAADYTTAKTRMAMLEAVIAGVMVLAWTLGGMLGLLDRLWTATGWSTIAAGTGFLLSIFVLGTLIDLPLDAYRTFSIEKRFGFNRITSRLFVSDTVKQVALTLVIGAPLVWLVLWLMHNSGPLWWLYVWGTWLGFSLLMLWAYPVIIAPLFNKFLPLDDAMLRSRIEALLHRCGFASNGIFIMDGSRRSSHGNAYFTGLGENKRIVFFDTLLKALSPEEVEAVLAHELGHFKRRHVQKRLLSMAALSLLSLALLGWLSGQPWFYLGLGVERPSLHSALALFLLVGPVFSFFLQPLMARLMRQHEFEADDFAAEQTNAQTLVTALVKLYEENANTLTPDPVYSAFHDSHPPAPVRVAHLLAKLHG